MVILSSIKSGALFLLEYIWGWVGQIPGEPWIPWLFWFYIDHV